MHTQSDDKEESRKGSNPSLLVRCGYMLTLLLFGYTCHLGAMYWIFGSKEERDARDAANQAWNVTEVLASRRNYYAVPDSEKLAFDVRKLQKACEDIPEAVTEYRGKVTAAYEAALAVANDECTALIRKALDNQDGLSKEIVGVSIERIRKAVETPGRPESERQEELYKKETEAKLRKVLDEAAAQGTQKQGFQ